MDSIDNILLAVALDRRDSESTETFLRLTTEDDWEELVKKAFRHGLLPLLFMHVKRYCRELIPVKTRQHLKQLYVANGLRNLYLTHVLLNILENLEKTAVQAVPFKGPILASTVYGSVAMRIFADLDILIDKDDLCKAVALLKEKGYVPELALPDAQYRSFATHEDSLSLTGDNGMVTIELHWELSGRYLTHPYTLKEVSPRLTKRSLLGWHTATLSTEDQLLHLCLHGTKHHWSELEQVVSIATMLRQNGIDWRQLFLLAQKFHCRRMLLMGLSLAYQLLEAPLPPHVLDEARQDGKMWKTALFAGAALPGQETKNRQPTKLISFRLRFSARDNTLDALRYGLRLCFTPSKAEWTRWRLPSACIFLYWLLRPLRVLGLATHALIKDR